MGRLGTGFEIRPSVAPMSMLSLSNLFFFLSILLSAANAQKYVQDFQVQVVNGANTLMWRPLATDPWYE